MTIELVEHVSAESRGEAWLAAVKRLAAPDAGGEAFHFLVEVRSPSVSTPLGRAIESTVDGFLRKHDAWPIQTVAETLFPASEYRRHGANGVYSYPTSVFPFIRDQWTNRWGTYAHRLTHRQLDSGEDVNPLRLCIEKMQSELGGKTTIRARYEIDVVDGAYDLSTYDTREDASGRMGDIPCLSHLGFKIHKRSRLLLAATYRNHYYIERLAGNLLGLAQLQQFVCDETGLSPGPLVCFSTLAKIDTNRSAKRPTGWTKSDVYDLVRRCELLD